MLIFAGILACLSVSTTAAGKLTKAERFAACGPAAKVLGNAMLEANGQALQYSVIFCPAVTARENGVIQAQRDNGVFRTERENGVVHAERDNGVMHGNIHSKRDNGSGLAIPEIVGGTNARQIGKAAGNIHSKRDNGLPIPEIVGGTNARQIGRAAGEIEGRQTCTQCPCANRSIQCFCSNTPGESGDSLFIPSCSNSDPPNPNIPVTADCTTLATLMVTGAPMGSSLNFPVKTNGYYNIPVGSILSWEFQGCEFALFNDVGSSYNICATDLVCYPSISSGFPADNLIWPVCLGKFCERRTGSVLPCSGQH
ncbi:hypothetical protein C8R45DRAFT_979494 [Mycena sanguinolenta]|nr:hypothetical protein C8R45DRAFT_979494 [Mycena sanguinolenta]